MNKKLLYFEPCERHVGDRHVSPFPTIRCRANLAYPVRHHKIDSWAADEVISVQPRFASVPGAARGTCGSATRGACGHARSRDLEGTTHCLPGRVGSRRGPARNCVVVTCGTHVTLHNFGRFASAPIGAYRMSLDCSRVSCVRFLLQVWRDDLPVSARVCPPLSSWTVNGAGGLPNSHVTGIRSHVCCSCTVLR